MLFIITPIFIEITCICTTFVFSYDFCYLLYVDLSSFLKNFMRGIRYVRTYYMYLFYNGFDKITQRSALESFSNE